MPVIAEIVLSDSVSENYTPEFIELTFGGETSLFGASLGDLLGHHLMDDAFELRFYNDDANLGDAGQFLVDSVEIEVFFLSFDAAGISGEGILVYDPPFAVPDSPFELTGGSGGPTGGAGCWAAGCSANGMIVLVGSRGRAAVSIDQGVTWTETETGTSATLYAVTHDGFDFYACGDGGLLMRSPDGVNWETYTAFNGADLYAVLADRRNTGILSFGADTLSDYGNGEVKVYTERWWPNYR